jgi:hypothetical protein
MSSVLDLWDRRPSWSHEEGMPGVFFFALMAYAYGQTVRNPTVDCPA